MKFRILSFLTLLAAFLGSSAVAQNAYGLPENIAQGNILHCFDWKFSDIRKELPNIAEAGFVAVQTSPCQRNVSSGWNWSDPYRPADFAFSNSGLGTKNDLINLCQEAETYGIKVIVDVVFNHVDQGSYHNAWWDNSGHLRSTTTGINYSNRTSITNDRLLTACPEVNTEHPEVIARAKAYIEELKECGVKGIRFDAAKHIALPSEGSQFWAEVTSVPGMFYYGEILGNPGGSNANALLKEYTQYMSVTDDSYSDRTRSNGGLPSAKAGHGLSTISESKCVYWGESHDTYANEGGKSKNVSQAVVDRAYAILACRNDGHALYFSRPSKTAYGDIKVGQKGSTHFTEPVISAVNNFKNEMVGKADAFVQANGVAVIARQNGGAVLVKQSGSGEISISNPSAFCPAGTYYDRVSGNKFTVTSSTISGKVGPTGVVVIYGDYIPGDGPIDQPTPDLYIYCTNPHNWSNVYVYMYSSGGAAVSNGNWPGQPMTKNGDMWEYKVPEELTYGAKVIFNDGNNGSQYPEDVPGQESGLDFNGKSMISDGTNWKEYVSAGVNDVIDDNFELEGAKWFTLQGVRVDNPSQPGLYIVVSRSGKSKKMLIKGF